MLREEAFELAPAESMPEGAAPLVRAERVELTGAPIVKRAAAGGAARRLALDADESIPAARRRPLL